MDTHGLHTRSRSHRRIPSIGRALVRAAALGLLCAACASTTPRPMLSGQAKVLDLPLVQQDEMYACGLVSITALCRYWNVEVPAAESERLAQRAREERGLSGGQLRDALSDLGFDAFLFRGALDHGTTGVLTHVDAGRPPLVMLAPSRDQRHYVLFVGYDEPNRNVCLLDPVRGQVLVPYETFERDWRACNHFTLLAVPRDYVATPTPKAETLARAGE